MMLYETRRCACGRPMACEVSLADLATEAARLGRLLAEMLAQEPVTVSLGFRAEVDELLDRLLSGDALMDKAGEALEVLGGAIESEVGRETRGTCRVLVSGVDQDGDEVLGYRTVPDRSPRGEALAAAQALLVDYRMTRLAALERAAGERAAARLTRG